MKKILPDVVLQAFHLHVCILSIMARQGCRALRFRQRLYSFVNFSVR